MELYIEKQSAEKWCPEIFGNKAYKLKEIYDLGWHIPKSYFISGKLLENIIINNNKKEFEKAVAGFNEYGKNIGKREWVKGLNIDSMLECILEKVRRSFNYPLIVRSSSSHEDSIKDSCAGIFESVGNILNEKDLIEAIQIVYSSKFTWQLDNAENICMGVIIQEYITPQYSGVAFSENPVTGENVICVEYGEGGCENVVEGSSHKYLELPKAGEFKKQMVLSDELLEKLRLAVVGIELELGYPIDIEWAYKEKQLVILQVRPITTIKKKKPVKGIIKYIDSLNKDELEKYDLTDIIERHKRYMEKHFLIRKKASQMGFPFPEVGYLFYNKNLIDQDILDQLVFNAKIYKIVSKEHVRTRGKNELLNYLKSLPGEDRIVRLQRCTLTNACGNASLTNDGFIFIEYMPGGFGGFMSGELEFSTLLVDSKGETISKDLKKYSRIWELNEKVGRFLPVDIEEDIYELTSKMIEQIVEITKNMDLIIGISSKARIEWEMEKDKIYLNDISFESNNIYSRQFCNQILSVGHMEGKVLKLYDIKNIMDILSGRSIVPEKDFYKALGSDRFKILLKDLGIKKDEKYIFIAPSAHSSLSLLIDFANGFIFEKGGMLSHLAIILRENKIPAFVKPHALELFNDGEKISESI